MLCLAGIRFGAAGSQRLPAKVIGNVRLATARCRNTRGFAITPKLNVRLTEDVKNVGYKGQIVAVARGFARNTLLPRKRASYITDGGRGGSKSREKAQDADVATDIEQRKFEDALLRHVSKCKPEFRRAEPGTGISSMEVLNKLQKRYGLHFLSLEDVQCPPMQKYGEYEVPLRLTAAGGKTVSLRVMFGPPQAKKATT